MGKILQTLIIILLLIVLFNGCYPKPFFSSLPQSYLQQATRKFGLQPLSRSHSKSTLRVTSVSSWGGTTFELNLVSDQEGNPLWRISIHSWKPTEPLRVDRRTLRVSAQTPLGRSAIAMLDQDFRHLLSKKIVDHESITIDGSEYLVERFHNSVYSDIYLTQDQMTPAPNALKEIIKYLYQL